MKSRMENNKIAAGDLGCYDGPPIGACEVFDRYRLNAIAGSQRLASRIDALGLRP